jgi:hypothetical protein
MPNNVFGTFLVMNLNDVKDNTATVSIVPHCMGGQMNGGKAYLKMGVPNDIFQRVTIQEDMAATLLVYDKKAFHAIQDKDGTDGLISDGYHTFDELYEHRIINFIALCKVIRNELTLHIVWRSELHSDGSRWDGWFILGINVDPGEQITYHLPISKWCDCDFVDITLDKAPEYDGHTPNDVLKRISEL